MKISKSISSILVGLVALNSQAAQIEVTITNLTQGIYYTPFVVAAHDDSFHIFQVGEEASEALQAQAEGGAIGGVVTLATDAGAVVEENPAGGFSQYKCLSGYRE